MHYSTIELRVARSCRSCTLLYVATGWPIIPLFFVRFGWATACTHPSYRSSPPLPPARPLMAALVFAADGSQSPFSPSFLASSGPVGSFGRAAKASWGSPDESPFVGFRTGPNPWCGLDHEEESVNVVTLVEFHNITVPFYDANESRA